MITYRAWIDQPSTLQPHNDLHGKVCICQDSGEEYVRVWFTDGPIHSMNMNRQAISRIRISKAG